MECINSRGIHRGLEEGIFCDGFFFVCDKFCQGLDRSLRRAFPQYFGKSKTGEREIIRFEKWVKERDLFWNKVFVRVSQNYNMNISKMKIYDVFLTLENLEKDSHG